MVFLADDSTICRHIDQLRPRTSKDDDISMDIIEDNDIDDQGPYFTHSPVIELSMTTAPSRLPSCSYPSSTYNSSIKS